jgi:hypothetical protein
MNIIFILSICSIKGLVITNELNKEDLSTIDTFLANSIVINTIALLCLAFFLLANPGYLTKKSIADSDNVIN